MLTKKPEVSIYDEEHVLAKQLLNAVWNEDVELAGIVLDAGADANWYFNGYPILLHEYLHAMRNGYATIGVWGTAGIGSLGICIGSRYRRNGSSTWLSSGMV